MSEGGEDPFDSLEASDEPEDPFAAFGEELFEDESIDADWEPSLEEGGVGPVENDAVVPKRSFCERCEFFAAPPEVSCSHPGTTIVELVDIGRLRVTNCPVVAHRRELGEYE
jgi:hypothetical protein